MYNAGMPAARTREELIALDQQFCDWLHRQNDNLYQRFLQMRGDIPDVYAQAPLLIELSPYLEDFIGQLFNIENEIKALQDQHHHLAPLYRVKRNFVQRIAVRKYKDVSEADYLAAIEGLGFRVLGLENELQFAKLVETWQTDSNEEKLELAGKIASYLSCHPEQASRKPNAAEGSALSGEERMANSTDPSAQTRSASLAQDDSILFKSPKKLDPANLLDLEEVTINGIRQLQSKHTRKRDGFSYTDKSISLAESLDEANYCIYCHNRQKDSCSKGLRDKKTGDFQVNSHDITLTGCPLEERISEMNLLKKDGYALGALAMAMVDNPLCAATGHRICNDCMKACIYQKQQPVDIPKIESETLQNILQLPYGFEIYNLLSLWNPLNLERSLPKPPSGHTILVVGMGPAGFNLAYHLIQDGHYVVGIDGLKIEPLPNQVWNDGIKDINTIWEDLDTRTTGGFGGVAEYGITVRWNKNNLTLIRMMLQRRQEFLLMGGVRFGSGLDRETAFSIGFSHIALCMGAGRPTIINMPNKLARGVRQASDFLMSLQLTGAARLDSPANLQVRLPVVVIGGGLTAIDTATEALAYYPRQVEKFLRLYEQIDPTTLNWTTEEQEIANTFLDHARQLRATDDKLALLQQWGGATVVYRKSLQESPSYRLNHEEVELAMEEGIRFAENLTPVTIEVDEYGATSHLKLRHSEQNRKAIAAEGPALPTIRSSLDSADPSTQTRFASLAQDDVLIEAKTILVAAGTKPNTVLAREDNIYKLTNNYFRAIDEQDNDIAPQYIAKPDQVSVLTQKTEDNRFTSFFGDLHPSYAGNVVKAMASAKQGYPTITNVLRNLTPQKLPQQIFDTINQDCTAIVHAVNRLAPGIVEVVVHAPLAARSFQPGQFYRLQNFEANAKSKAGLKLAMEGLAVTGASVDTEKGLMSTIVLEMGGSSNLCAHLKQGEEVVLMGPTGTPTEIPKNTTVILCGGGLGNAVLFSIGKACRAAGSKVIYFAGYKTAASRVKIDEIEAAADTIIWCCDEEKLSISRPQDFSFHGNIVEAMQWYALMPNAKSLMPLSNATHLIVIGSDRMMAAVATTRHTVLKPYLNPDHLAVGSINSPMQCMMKEICAQCLQIHKDPVTGEETTVFSCFNQDQKLDNVCFNNLDTRLKQNNTAEKLVRAVLQA